MKRHLTIILLAILASCAPAPTPQVLPTETATLIPYTPTFAIPTVSPTSTPVACDPFEADFCVSDGKFLLQRPVQSPANTRIDPTYGYASIANGQRDPHHGVEFLNKFGTPVYAAGNGTVVFAGADRDAIYSPWSNFYGNMVVLRHLDDLYTVYAHLSRIDVEANQQVFVGDQIGEVGQSGVAVGPHLHFEVRRGEVENYYSTLNPELWLVPNQTKDGHLGVLQIAILHEGNRLVEFAKYTVQFLSSTRKTQRRNFYGVTYSADMLRGEENAVMGDMIPGEYRIAFKYDGQLYERQVEVKSGKLTQVVFIVK